VLGDVLELACQQGPAVSQAVPVELTELGDDLLR
jgi:hypothetical protein